MRTVQNLISPAISSSDRPSWSAQPPNCQTALTAHEAIKGIQQVIDEEIAELIECGLEPPPSIPGRRYSGRFVVRTSPELHSRLMVDAAEQGVSFNQWVVQKLAGRNPPTLHDLF